MGGSAGKGARRCLKGIRASGEEAVGSSGVDEQHSAAMRMVSTKVRCPGCRWSAGEGEAVRGPGHHTCACA
jgi:hypothetical protein